MANPIVPKYNAIALSTAAPGALALTTGELASNLTTGRLYLKLHDGSVADVVPVKTVNGATGDVVITTASIGALGTQQLGAINGVAGLGADGKLVSSQLPTIQTSDLGCLTTSAIAGLVPQLDSTGKISMAQIPSSLQGALNYQGVWNASTNDPALASSTGTKGHYYVVSVAGSTNLDGHTDWLVGDLVIFDGSTWDKVSGNDSEVISVNGQTPINGNVTLTPANIGAISTAAINAINGVAGLNGSAQVGTAQLPAATTASLGAIIVGDNLTVDGSGRVSAVQGTYTLPAATTASLGGIIAGSGLAIQLNGTLSAPVATASSAGIIQPGTGLLVDGNGVLTPDSNVVITTSSPSTVFNGGTY